MAKITTITTSLLLLLSTRPTTAQKTTITITAAPSIPSSSPSYTNDTTFTSAILNSTNTYRTQHNASQVLWNATLATFAQTYLSSANCKFAHSGGPYGENLALGYASARAAVEAWGDEGEAYNYENPGFSEKTGHFSQLVWKDTTDVGCGRRLCGERGWYLACEYWPPGNVIGAFGGEVDGAVNGGERGRGKVCWRAGWGVVGGVVVWMVLW